MNIPCPALSVVIPACEEAANLEIILPALNLELGRLSIPYEIVVVDMPEPCDDTPGVCARHRVSHVPRVGGASYGDAVRTGIAAAGAAHIIFMDADGSHPPDVIAKLWDERDHADLVVASRYVCGGSTENPAVLIILSMIVNIIFRLVLGIECADVSNSFRLYRGGDLRELVLACSNFDIIEEILVKLCSSHPHYTVLEIPFRFEKRKAGKTKRSLLPFTVGFLVTLLRLRRLRRAATTQLLEDSA